MCYKGKGDIAVIFSGSVHGSKFCSEYVMKMKMWIVFSTFRIWNRIGFIQIAKKECMQTYLLRVT